MKWPRKPKQMYAIFCEDVGIISGTLAYSRADAIKHFSPEFDWGAAGYKTVAVKVRIMPPTRRKAKCAERPSPERATD